MVAKAIEDYIAKLEENVNKISDPKAWLTNRSLFSILKLTQSVIAVANNLVMAEGETDWHVALI